MDSVPINVLVTLDENYIPYLNDALNPDPP